VNLKDFDYEFEDRALASLVTGSGAILRVFFGSGPRAFTSARVKV